MVPAVYHFHCNVKEIWMRSFHPMTSTTTIIETTKLAPPTVVAAADAAAAAPRRPCMQQILRTGPLAKWKYTGSYSPWFV